MRCTRALTNQLSQRNFLKDSVYLGGEILFSSIALRAFCQPLSASIIDMAFLCLRRDHPSALTAHHKPFQSKMFY